MLSNVPSIIDSILEYLRFRLLRLVRPLKSELSSTCFPLNLSLAIR